LQAFYLENKGKKGGAYVMVMRRYRLIGLIFIDTTPPFAMVPLIFWGRIPLTSPIKQAQALGYFGGYRLGIYPG